MIYYLDTNIFIYAADPESPYHKACKALLKEVARGSLSGTTSVETIQEIIYFHQRQKQLMQGLRLIDDIFKIVPELLSVDQEVVFEFRRFLDKYPHTPSRDLIHLATCKVYGLTEVVSIDRDFDKFKEINRIQPEKLVLQT